MLRKPELRDDGTVDEDPGGTGVEFEIVVVIADRHPHVDGPVAKTRGNAHDGFPGGQRERIAERRRDREIGVGDARFDVVRDEHAILVVLRRAVAFVFVIRARVAADAPEIVVRRRNRRSAEALRDVTDDEAAFARDVVRFDVAVAVRPPHFPSVDRPRGAADASRDDFSFRDRRGRRRGASDAREPVRVALPRATGERAALRLDAAALLDVDSIVAAPPFDERARAVRERNAPPFDLGGRRRADGGGDDGIELRGGRRRRLAARRAATGNARGADEQRERDDDDASPLPRHGLTRRPYPR